jgi:hypothetical protein
MLAIFRRRLIVSGLQHRLLAGNFLYLLSIVIVFVSAGFAPLILTLDNTTLPAEIRDAAAQRLLLIQDWMWVVIPMIIGLCILHSVFVSHRIAGPLYRFNRIFRQVGNGDLSINIRIRKADYLWPETHCLNEMIQGLARRVEQINADYRGASGTLPQIIQALGRQDTQEAIVLCGKLGTQLDHLGGRVAEFRLPLRDGEPVAAMPEEAASPDTVDHVA